MPRQDFFGSFLSPSHVAQSFVGATQSTLEYGGQFTLSTKLIYTLSLFTYKALKALAPQYISDFLVQYKPPRALRSSDKKLLQVPHFKLKSYGGRSFSYIAPYLWNQLPDAIRQAPLLATFKSNLKTYLFDQV